MSASGKIKVKMNFIGIVEKFLKILRNFVEL